VTATAYVKQWAQATYGGVETVLTFNLAAAATPGNVLVMIAGTKAGTAMARLSGTSQVWSQTYRQNGIHAFTVLTHVVGAGEGSTYGFTGGTTSDQEPVDGYLLELTGTDLSRGLSLAVSSAYDVKNLTTGVVDAVASFQPGSQPPDVLAVTLGFLTGSSSAVSITQTSAGPGDVTLTQRSTGGPSYTAGTTRSAIFLRELTDLTVDSTVSGGRITATPAAGGMPMDRMTAGVLILPLGPVTTVADAAFNVVQDDGVCTFQPARTDGTHLWTFGDATATSTTASPTHTYVPGTYTATHKWTDSKGVSATATKTFTARAAGDRIKAMKDVVRLEVSTDGVTWADMIATCTQVSARREILGVGTLNATFKGSTYDPATRTTFAIGKRMRLMGLDAGTWKPLWVGRISEARLTGGNVRVEGVDNTAILDRTGYQDCVRSFAEIGPALTASGLTYTAPTQTSPFVVAQIAKGTVLDQLLITRDTVKGHAWVARDGSVKVMTTRPATIAGVFAESAYSQLTVEQNLDQVVNDVTVKFLRYLPNSGACEPIEYGPFRAASVGITTVGMRSATYTIVGAVEDPAAIQSYGNSITTANGGSVVAPTALRFPIRKTGDVSTSRALVDLNDLVTVTNAEKAINRNMRVATVAHEITPSTWQVDLELDVDGYVALPIETTEPTGDTHSHFLEQLYDVYTDNTGSGPSDGSVLTYRAEPDLWLAEAAPVDTGWVTCTLKPGFTWQGTAGSEAIQVRKRGNVVYIRGAVNGTGFPLYPATPTVATLPPGFAPTKNVVNSCGVSSGKASAVAFITSGGDLQIRPNDVASGYYFFGGFTWTTD